MKTQVGNWWTRPCGGWEVLKVALPLVASTMSFTIMHFCDRMFLGWHSTASMAAALPAGMLNWTLFALPMGIAGYANTFVAQYSGAGREERIGPCVWQAVRIGMYSAPVFLVIAQFAPWVFQLFGHEESILWLEVLYMRVLAMGSGAVVLCAALSSFFIGQGRTRTVMSVNIVAALLNIFLDVVWIFGWFGFPEAGIEGAAYATVVSQWFKVACYAFLMYRPANIDRFNLRGGRAFDWTLLKRMLRFGGPNGLQYIVEGSAMTLFGLFVMRLGEHEAAATTVAFNVNMIAFIPMIGVGIAVSTLVGKQIGAGKPELAARATWTAIILATVYTTAFGAMYLTVPRWFMFGHAAGAADFAAVETTVIILLRFVTAYCLFDAYQMIFTSAIKGAGDTRFVLIVTFIMSSTFALCGYVGAYHGGWRLYDWWWMLTGWISILGVIYFLRFIHGAWRKMKVIEPDLVSLPKKKQSLEETVAFAEETAT